MIKSCLEPSIEETRKLCALFTKSAKGVTSQIHLVVLDEHLNKYKPDKTTKAKANAQGEPIPVQYIPRKPNPNGLLVYLLSTYVANPLYDSSNLPFILDFEPHLTTGDSNPNEMVALFLNRWNREDRPSIIGDAAFGSLESLQFISNWGSTGTFSINVTHQAYLWAVLRSDLPPDHWRYAQFKSMPIYASCHCLVSSSNSIVYQQLFTSMVAGTEDEESSDDTDSSESSSEEEIALIPKYTRATLLKMTVANLREITKKFNIKQGKCKVDTINNIRTRVRMMHNDEDEIRKLMRKARDSVLPDPAVFHQLYGDYFNLVDMADKYWYMVDENHRNHLWKSHLILGLLRFQIYNSWVLATTLMPESWMCYRRTLSRRMRYY